MRYNVVFVGSVSAGKTSIIQRYCKKIFVEKHVSTIAVDFQPITIGEIQLSLWDTCGQERFMSITSSYYMRGHVFVLVHDAAEPDIDKNLKYWYKEIDKRRPPRHTPVIIVVSNKMDKSKSRKDVRDWCRKNLFEHVETSAKTGVGISALFDKVCDAALVHGSDWTNGTSLPTLPETPNAPSPGCAC